MMRDTDTLDPSTVRAVRHKINTAAPIPNAPKISTGVALDDDVYNMLLRQGRQVLGVYTASKGWIEISPGWHAITGYPVANSLGQQLLDRVHAQHRAKLVRAIEHYEKGAQAKPVRCQFRHAEGHWLWLECVPVSTSSGRDGRKITVALRDISLEVDSQKKAQKASLESELALNSRSEFLAHMSHELRTPLNAILGFAQMMENQVYGPVGNEKYQEYVGSIKQSGHTLLSKLNDLFELSHIDAGYAELCEEKVDLQELIEQAVEMHSHKAFRYQVSVKAHGQRGSVAVWVDRVRMLKVLVNLLSNAIKFNKAGGQVTISSDVTDDRGLVITMRDTGQGFRNGELQKIIRSVRHEDGFLSRDRYQSGLGLALAAELIKLHGGSVDIDSKEGKGSQIAIMLPKGRVLEEHIGGKAKRRSIA